MEAAIGVVALVVGLVKFLGLDDLQGNLLVVGKGCGLLKVATGQRGRIGQDGEHFVAEDAVRGGGEIRRVDPAGVGDHQGAQLLEASLEGLELGKGFRSAGGSEGLAGRFGISMRDFCHWTDCHEADYNLFAISGSTGKFSDLLRLNRSN